MKSFAELDEFLKDEKNKEAFGGIIKNMGYYTKEDIDNEVTGLKNTNTNLKGEKLKLQKDYEEIKAKIDEIDFDEYKSLKEKNKSNDKGSEQLENLQKQLKTLETKLKQKEDYETSLKKENESILMDDKLNEAIDEKFDPKHKKLLIAAYRNKAKINETDGKKDVFIDDENLGFLSAKEFFNKFITTDEGKTYAYVPINKGAGSQKFSGSSSTGSKKTVTQAEFNTFSEKEKIAFSKEVLTGNAQILP